MSSTQQAEGSSVATSCAGAGQPAVEGSVLQEGATRKTGVCPSCGDRVRLGSGGLLREHTAAAGR